MNQAKIWSVVALSTTVVGLPSVAKAATPDATPDGTSSHQNTTASNDAVKSEKSEIVAKKSESVITQTHTYNLDGREATTLYVRNIPLLTFIEQEGNANTVDRANTVASKINQLISDKIDPDQISVSWKKGSHIIKVNNEDLVEINSYTRLPDTTNNLAQDALQATNRLRRLAGNAQPLKQISNLVASEKTVPQQVVKKQEEIVKPQVAVKKTEQATVKKQESIKKTEQSASKPEDIAKKREIAKKLLEKKRSQENAKANVRSTSRGIASYYGNESGNRTATGERFNPNLLTAAHRTLPFGTRVRVTNTRNGNSVIVRINDRGPFIGGRVIDVSTAAAQRLGMIGSGVASVKIEVLN
jgi:rare lipoprotein A